MTATERAQAEQARRQAERAQYGNRPGEGVIAATVRQHDPHHGAGFTPADEIALRDLNRTALIDALAGKQAELETLQEQYAALRIEAEFDFSARCALHSQVCRYGQALTLIANLPLAEDGLPPRSSAGAGRAAEQLRTARALADKAIHVVAAVPARRLPAENARNVQVAQA